MLLLARSLKPEFGFGVKLEPKATGVGAVTLRAGVEDCVVATLNRKLANGVLLLMTFALEISSSVVVSSKDALVLVFAKLMVNVEFLSRLLASLVEFSKLLLGDLLKPTPF